jgi:hypothetical protein
MTESDLELLVNDALEKELRMEAGRPDRMVPSGNPKWIACLPHGEILRFRIAISERDAIYVGTEKNGQREDVIGNRNS